VGARARGDNRRSAQPPATRGRAGADGPPNAERGQPGSPRTPPPGLASHRRACHRHRRPNRTARIVSLRRPGRPGPDARAGAARSPGEATEVSGRPRRTGGAGTRVRSVSGSAPSAGRGGVGSNPERAPGSRRIRRDDRRDRLGGGTQGRPRTARGRGQLEPALEQDRPRSLGQPADPQAGQEGSRSCGRWMARAPGRRGGRR